MAEGKDKTSLYRADPGEIWKETVRHEIKSKIDWEDEWGFLIDSYKKCQKDCEAVDALKQEETKETQEKSLPPYPKTTSKQFGWLSGQEEFNHEKFGHVAKPIGTLYKTLDWPIEGCP